AGRAREPRLRIDLAFLHEAVPEGAVGAVRAGGPASGALGRADRRGGRVAPARLRGAAWAVQAGDDGTTRRRVRQGARAAGPAQVAPPLSDARAELEARPRRARSRARELLADPMRHRLPDSEAASRSKLLLGPPRVQAPGPFLELALGVVAAVPATAEMQAHVAPCGGRLVALEGPARVVAHDERTAVCAQQGMDLGREPALVAELERMAPGRQLFQGTSQEPNVATKALSGSCHSTALRRPARASGSMRSQ